MAKEILMKDLDELVENLEKTFKNGKEKFEQDEENPNCFWLTDTECDFKINGLLIDFSQISNVNWGTVKYLEQRGYSVYAGEKDSFGWLTGIIEPMPVTKEVLGIDEGKKYIIVFG